MNAGLLAFLIALSASLLLTVPVRALAIRVGMVDLPGPRKVHLKPIPLLGGLAMYAAVMLAILIAFDGLARAQSLGIVTGATLVAIVGFLDDKGLLHHQVKLFLAMPLAAVILLISGIHAQLFSVLVGGRIGSWLDAAFTILWVVGITASFSILDHMHSGPYGRPLRRVGRHGGSILCLARLFARANLGRHSRCQRTGCLCRLSPLEF
jgi:UDP-GlcNAc:undecaprenyl-phosphate GlcNAc-1-phosphate transferase